MTAQITQKIKSFSVKNTQDQNQEKPMQEASAKPELKQEFIKMNEKLVRPEQLFGYTYKIKPVGMEHAMYVTINNILLNEGTEQEHYSPFEIFINSKNMEEFQWVVALTRIMSAVFRKGGDIIFMIDELKAVFDPKGGYWKPGTGLFVPSVVAEIGLVLEKHLENIGLLKKEGLSDAQKTLIAEKRSALEKKSNVNQSAESDAQYPPSATLCQKCYQKAIIIMDGCATCLSCGHSKCG